MGSPGSGFMYISSVWNICGAILLWMSSDSRKSLCLYELTHASLPPSLTVSYFLHLQQQCMTTHVTTRGGERWTVRSVFFQIYIRSKIPYQRPLHGNAALPSSTTPMDHLMYCGYRHIGLDTFCGKTTHYVCSCQCCIQTCKKELKHYKSSKMDAISAHSKVGIGTHTFLFDWG
jgi:hypothetical protein